MTADIPIKLSATILAIKSSASFVPTDIDRIPLSDSNRITNNAICNKNIPLFSKL